MKGRRSFIAGLVLAPVIVATPAMAQEISLICKPADPVDEFWAAFHAYDGDEGDDGPTGARYDRAVDVLDNWEPPSHRDFIRKFLAMFADGGNPNDERLGMLIEQGECFALRA